jgi:hypothetical protein
MATIDARLSARRPEWMGQALAGVRRDGFAIVEDAPSADALERTREAMYGVQERIREDVGADRLDRAGELGVLRLMLRYERHFVSLWSSSRCSRSSTRSCRRLRSCICRTA